MIISLRKHIESYHDPLSESSLLAFRSALEAWGEFGPRAVPGSGEELQQKLASIEAGLRSEVTPDSVEDARRQFGVELARWAEQAHQRHGDNEREMKEITSAVARMAESLSQRDERCSREIGSLTDQLRSIAELNDVTAIRRSVLEGARALRTCVEQMVDEGRKSVAKLTSEVADYRARLEATQRIASLDSLTGLANRRTFEAHLEERVRASFPFSLVLIDLDEFKRVNDRYGHMAGDDLLRQFAVELRNQFLPGDLVARWGGDEFAVLVNGACDAANDRVCRIRRWALGEYGIREGAKSVRVTVKASIGVVEWDRAETGMELLARADLRLYANK